MINNEDLKEFLRIRKEIFEYIEEELKEDGHCKHYEGAMEMRIYFPNYFEKSDVPKYCIDLHCYLIGTKRHYRYSGLTIRECLDNLARDLILWQNGKPEEFNDDNSY